MISRPFSTSSSRRTSMMVRRVKLKKQTTNKEVKLRMDRRKRPTESAPFNINDAFDFKVIIHKYFSIRSLRVTLP